MNRRTLLMLAGGLPLMSTAHAQTAKPAFRRSRPGDAALAVGRPMERSSTPRSAASSSQVRSPLEACRSGARQRRVRGASSAA